jgi:glycosyltransferase involved in cell wall biosynthesis
LRKRGLYASIFLQLRSAQRNLFFFDWKVPGKEHLKKLKGKLSQKVMRQIAWETGRVFPIPFSSDYLSLSMVQPRLGHAHWNVQAESVEKLILSRGDSLRGAPLIVRVYDVTEIVFDGSNAHAFFDLHAGSLAGNYYFRVDSPARNYLAEAGLRGRDGFFASLARSNAVFFDRDRPSGNYQVSGLFVGGSQNRTFSVENIFDAPVYERMNRELREVQREGPLSIAAVFLGSFGSPLGSFIMDCSRKIETFGGDVRFFTRRRENEGHEAAEPVPDKIKYFSKQICEELGAAHRQKPFHLIHCHDWYSSIAGLAASRTLNIPLILSLHSTEHERIQGREMDSLSSAICEEEKNGVRGASMVIVPHSSTREQAIDLYGCPPGRIIIIPDVIQGKHGGLRPGVPDAKRWLGLGQDTPVILFAGEISHSAGADLLIDALPTVCRNHHTAHFVFAGDGPLRGELEARVRHSGFGHRCRFLGDVPRETFESLLDASDFVVIPARTWQDEGLAQTAINSGRPVLTTHQAGINCVSHGKNGLITFDNPGSIVWGIQELLFNPLKESMFRFAAKKRAGDVPTLESIAVQHYICYEMLLKGLTGGAYA